MELYKKILKYIEREKWYHGTTLFGWKKICSLGVRADYNKGNELDFGYGFYLTPEQRQAEAYIARLLEYKLGAELGMPTKNSEDKKIPIIIEFSFCPLEWYNENKYKFKFLSTYDNDFANFVFHNRVNNVDGNQQHDFDIIFGVMSDSVPTVLIQKYKQHDISKDEVIYALKKSTSVKQLSLHKQEICDIIKPTRVYYLNTGEELNINDYYDR